MKITHIDTIPVQVPIHPKRAVRGSLGAHTTSPFLLLKIHTDEGITGLGEVSCTPIWSGEDQVTADHFIKDFIAPMLRGEDPGSDEVLSRFNAARRADVASRTFVIDMANRSLLSDFLPLQMARATGMHLLGALAPLRRIAMQEGLAPSWRPASASRGRPAGRS